MKDDLLELPIGEILVKEPMAKHTSFKIGGPANYLCLPDSFESTRRLVEFLRDRDMDFYLIGNGTNLLVSDKGVDLVVIKLAKNLSEIKVEGNILTAMAGASLTESSKVSFRHGLTGMEGLSGIPGNIGGAITMNAGAYGTDVKDVLDKVVVIDKNNEIVEINAKDMSLGYRQSRVMDEGLIVLSASFKLEEGNPEEINAKYEELKNLRITKQPLEKASAGSTFKRPEGHTAAKLIDDAGLKGYRYKNAMVSDKHAGFVIAEPPSSFDEVMTVINHVQEVVFDKFGVKLEPEVRILGE